MLTSSTSTPVAGSSIQRHGFSAKTRTAAVPSNGARGPRRLRPLPTAVPSLWHTRPGATPRHASVHHVLVSELSTSAGMTKAVVIGAGFGGLAATSARRRRRRRHPRRPAQLPHLPAAALRGRRPPDSTRPTLCTPCAASSDARPNVTFRERAVTGVDWDCATDLELDGASSIARVRLSRGRSGLDHRILRRRRGGGVRFPALHARRRDQPAQPHPRTVRSGRRRSLVARRRRAARS